MHTFQLGISLGEQETESASESAQFINYENTDFVAADLFDHTDTKDSHYSMRLMGNGREKVGLANSISVMTGDTLRMEVFGKFVDMKAKDDPKVMALLAALTLASPVGVGSELTSVAQQAATGQQSLAGLLAGEKDENDAPPAYLNYLFFDQDMNFKTGGYMQMTDAAREDGTNVEHEKMAMEVVAEEPGFYYIYLSNSGSIGDEAYFDDFTLTVAESYIVQTTDYYPFGRVAKTFVRAGEKETKDLFQGKTYEDLTGWYDFHARQYDATLGRWFAVDPQGQFASPYNGMGNNPINMIDPDGKLVWFVPVIIGAVVGGTAGGIIADKNGQDWYKGAITGAFIGAAAGLGVSAAIGPAGGITGMTVGNSTLATAELTKAWGIASTAIQGANVNMAMTAISGGNLDNVYKSGVVGAVSGAFTASGGFGMVNAWGAESKTAQFIGRQLYQGIGTASRSIGNNWAMGRDPFSRVTVGVGPVNLTFGKGQQLLQWQNNIGNIATNAFGLTNLAFGGTAKFNWEHLTPMYGGGMIDKFFDGTWGAHSILYRSDQYRAEGKRLISHELHHIWQSRALGDSYLANYAGQGLLGLLMGRPFNFGYAAYYPNYFENQAYYYQWFR